MKFLKTTLLANLFLFLGAFLILITNPFRTLAILLLKKAQEYSGEEIFLKELKEKYEKIIRARDEDTYSRKSAQLDQEPLHSTRYQGREELSEGSPVISEQEGNLDSQCEEGTEDPLITRIGNPSARAQINRALSARYGTKKKDSSFELGRDSSL